MQEYLVVHIGWGNETRIAKVSAEDEKQARIKGFALLEDAPEEDIDLDELNDETVTAIPVTEIVIQGVS